VNKTGNGEKTRNPSLGISARDRRHEEKEHEEEAQQQQQQRVLWDLFVFWAFLWGCLFGGGGGVECFVELDFLFTTFQAS